MAEVTSAVDSDNHSAWSTITLQYYSQLLLHLVNQCNPNAVISYARPREGLYVPVMQSRLVMLMKVMATEKKKKEKRIYLKG